MANIQDVGQMIFDELGWVDSWKLQKLTYYAQAWSLVWDGDQIFDERFVAWGDGPVSTDLHRDNKYGKVGGIFGTVLPGADVNNLTERQKDVVRAVLEHYRDRTKTELIASTHNEPPWQEARGDLAPNAYCSIEISQRRMRNSYSLMALWSPDVPTAPLSEGSDAAPPSNDCVDAELARWSHTLEWLSTR